jgi:hypothetical protein
MAYHSTSNAMRQAARDVAAGQGHLAVEGRYIVFTCNGRTLRFDCDSPNKAPKVLRRLVGRTH